MHITIGQPYSFIQMGQRNKQEDARFPNENIPQKYTSFFIVCDGVGGNRKGEMASQTVCKAFSKALHNVDWKKDFPDESLKKAFSHTYKKFFYKAATNSLDMETTLASVCFCEKGCIVAHIGDSRIYHIRPHKGILYCSNDHSLVNSLVHSGRLTPEEAIKHPDRNVITRSIHIVKSEEEQLKVTVMRTENIEAGDYFFLCTDGVSDQLSDEQLISILNEKDTDKIKCQKIASLSQKSLDNNTGYLVPITAVENETQSEEYLQASNNNLNTMSCQGERFITDIIVPTQKSMCARIIYLWNTLIRK